MSLDQRQLSFASFQQLVITREAKRLIKILALDLPFAVHSDFQVFFCVKLAWKRAIRRCIVECCPPIQFPR